MFAGMMNDTVSLHKKNGEIINDIKASVQKKIYTMRGDILIESEDLIIRKMSNGGQETYEVINPGFYETINGIPAHYQIEVRLLGAPEAKKAEQTIINNYHLSGNNNRVNNNSKDLSVNIVSGNPELQKHLGDLRAAIEELTISPQEKTEAYEIVDAVEGGLKEDKPNKTIIKTLLKGLPVAANIASIAGAIIACL